MKDIYMKIIKEIFLINIFKEHTSIITVEEGVINGGLGSSINTFAAKNNFKNNIINRGVSDVFIEHGTVKQLLEQNKLDTLSLTELFNEINHE
jgi:1-deoxy-D-xylulose-5-phosphate synthase